MAEWTVAQRPIDSEPFSYTLSNYSGGVLMNIRWDGGQWTGSATRDGQVYCFSHIYKIKVFENLKKYLNMGYLTLPEGGEK